MRKIKNTANSRLAKLGGVLLITTLFLLACNENRKINDNGDLKLKSNAKKNDSTSVESLKNKVSAINKAEVIYDTLVFEQATKGKLIEEKFSSAKAKLKFYKKFIRPGDINKLKIFKKEHSETEITYLGKLSDLKTKKSYHIITNFTIWGIGQMLSPRGRSEVAFLNGDQIIIYNLPMPEDLPKSIRNNVLFFQYEKIKIGISISGGLPPELCIPEIGCN